MNAVSFQNIPQDVVLNNILPYISGPEMGRMERTCRQINQIINTEENWKKACERDFINKPKPTGITWKGHYETCYKHTTLKYRAMKVYNRTYNEIYNLLPEKVVSFILFNDSFFFISGSLFAAYRMSGIIGSTLVGVSSLSGGIIVYSSYDHDFKIFIVCTRMLASIFAGSIKVTLFLGAKTGSYSALVCVGTNLVCFTTTIAIARVLSNYRHFNDMTEISVLVITATVISAISGLVSGFGPYVGMGALCGAIGGGFLSCFIGLSNEFLGRRIASLPPVRSLCGHVGGGISYLKIWFKG